MKIHPINCPPLFEQQKDEILLTEDIFFYSTEMNNQILYTGVWNKYKFNDDPFNNSLVSICLVEL